MVQYKNKKYYYLKDIVDFANTIYKVSISSSIESIEVYYEDYGSQYLTIIINDTDRYIFNYRCIDGLPDTVKADVMVRTFYRHYIANESNIDMIKKAIKALYINIDDYFS